MVAKFGDKFTVQNCNSKSSPGDTHSGVKRTARTPENIEAVRVAVTADRTKELFDPTVVSGRRNGLGISQSTFARIVKEDLKLHCYKLERRFEMHPGDKERRLNFARRIIGLSDQQLLNMAFSDEAYFTLDGEVNTQNIRRYAPMGERPEGFIHTTNKFPKKVMVFLGLHSSGKTFSLKFFETGETMKAKDYHSLLQYRCFPELRALNPDNPGSLEGMIWTQDGARIHRSKENTAYLDRQFQERQFSLGSLLAPEWPAR